MFEEGYKPYALGKNESRGKIGRERQNDPPSHFPIASRAMPEQAPTFPFADNPVSGTFMANEARSTRKRKGKIPGKRFCLGFLVAPPLLQARSESASPVHLSAANQRRHKKGDAGDNKKDWQESELDIGQLPARGFKKAREQGFLLFVDKQGIVRRMLAAIPLPRQESAK